MNKDLKNNVIYSFKELPTEAQKDFLVQFENEFEFDPKEYTFSLEIISYQKLLEEFDLILGANLIDELENDYIIELAQDIKDNGLKNPPICSEGIHRSLAHLYLKKDMLRFEII